MPTVTLHEFIARIESLLQQEAYERAIALCQHGLRSYPRCVDFYRMLGQACLETNRPDDAADMFRRVLGVDPQNFVAHVGLGVVAEGIGAADEALWQWERALEIEPNHAAVREEWQQLRAKRDNAPPAGRVKLNRAALGYIYLRGEQYERAALEFRGVLAGYSPDAEGRHERLDLHVALAEALYRGGRQREAGELCRQVLKTLPNALKPNLILGDIDLETGREDEGRLLFEHAQLLDPENAVAAQLLHPPARMPRRVVAIAEPGSTFPLPQAAEQTTAQAAEAGAAAEPLSPEEEGLPDWLRTLRVHRANVPPVREEWFDTAKTPEWLEAAPDIMLVHPPHAPGSVIDAVPAESAAPTLAEAPQQPSAAEPATDPAAPDWLRQLRQPDPTHELPGLAPASLEAKSADSVAASAATATSHETAPLDSVAASAAASHTDAPLDSVAASAAAVAPHTDAPLDSAPPSTEAPPAHDTTFADNLASTASALSAHDAPPAEGFAPPAAHEATAEARAAPIPDWLADLRQSATAVSESTAAHVPLDAPESPAVPLPDWLMDLEKPSAASAELDSTAGRLAEAAASIESPWMLAPESSPGSEHAAGATPAATNPQAPAASAEPPASPTMPTQEAATQPAVVGAPADAAPRVDLTAPASEPEHAAMAVEAVAPAHAEMAAPEGLTVPDTEAKSAHAPLAASEAQPHAEALSPAVVEPGPQSPSPAPPASPEVSAVPLSAEAQEPPTGVAEYQARLDLARVMKDTDLDSSLELYALMAGADSNLRSQAIAEVAALARLHPAAVATLQHLRAYDPAAAPRPAEAAAPATNAAAAAGAQPAQALPLGEALTHLADAAAPAAIEAQVEPTGAAQYAARLELARMLVDLDRDTALDQYELMAGAEPALLQQAIADVSTLSTIHAGEARAHVVLSRLQGGTAAPRASTPAVERTTPDVAETPAVASPSAADSAAEGELAAGKAPAATSPFSVPMEHTMAGTPAAAGVPVEAAPAPSTRAAASEAAPMPDAHAAAAISGEAPETQEALHEASATGAAAREPLAPVVSEEAMEPGTSVDGGPAPAQLLPIVDASLAEAEPDTRAPREASGSPDDSVESHAKAAAAADFQARLALARAMRPIDADVALTQYAQLAGAGADVRHDALSDLQALLPEHPRAAEIMAGLRSATPAPAAPDWLADAQTPSPADTRVPPVEPVVAEEAMEEELVAPAQDTAAHVPPHAASAAAGEQPAHEVAPVVAETAAQPVDNTLVPIANSTDATVTEPLVGETVAHPQGHAATAATQSVVTTKVEPVVAETASLPVHAEPAAAHAAIAATPGEPDSAAPPVQEPHGAAPVGHADIHSIAAEPVLAEMEAMIPAPAVQAPAQESAVAGAVAPHPEEPAPTVHAAADLAAGAMRPAESTVVAEGLHQVAEPSEPAPEVAATRAEESAAAPASILQRAHAALIAAVAPEGTILIEPETPPAAQDEAGKSPAAPVHLAEPVAATAGHERTAPVADEASPAAAHAEQQPLTEQEAPSPQHEAQPTAQDALPPVEQAKAAAHHEPSAVAPGEPPPTNKETAVAQHEADAAAHDALPTIEPDMAAAQPEATPTPHVAPLVLEKDVDVPQPAHAAADTPPLSETPAATTAEAAAGTRLERARVLLEISQQESAAQYQLLIDGGMLLPEVIADLQSFVQAQPGARHMRMLLAEAYAQAGRHQEAVDQYRKLV